MDMVVRAVVFVLVFASFVAIVAGVVAITMITTDVVSLTVVAAIRVAVTTHVVAVSVTVFQEAISSVTTVLAPILGGRENLANCLGTRNNSLALTTFANLVVCWS